MSKASLQDRSGLIEAFLERAGWAGVDRSILAADASFRSYDRLHGDNRKAVLMNAPPPQEDIRSFLRIGKILTRLGLSAPEIFASDTEAGLILLEDFGDRTYTNLLREDPSREFELYSLAVDVLIDLHRRFEGAAHVPDYDDDRLLDEAGLLFDWYLPEVGSLGLDLSDAVRSDYIELWRKIMPLARQAPKTLVLRDYHVDNLMLLEDRGGVARCGLLDFQDAVIGPSSYDLASLLEDARRDVPPTLARQLRDRYFDAFPDLDREAFMTSYAVMAAQRSAKIIGIFTRLARRDGKPDYLRHIPRTWRWLEGDLGHPALRDLQNWFDQIIPKATRVTPNINRAVA